MSASAANFTFRRLMPVAPKAGGSWARSSQRATVRRTGSRAGGVDGATLDQAHAELPKQAQRGRQPRCATLLDFRPDENVPAAEAPIDASAQIATVRLSAAMCCS